ncbi:hypothetical protein [Aliivibrio kagoshimensis]|uniref:hypothetical protein n=1 Tax=Aliivibrio kagoshimensis TaxID=2910230 RepID=UPI003D0B3828
MKDRKTLASNSGFSLIQVIEVDDNGNILSTSYEVVDPDGKTIGCFGSLKEAQDFLKNILDPEPPGSYGLGM